MQSVLAPGASVVAGQETGPAFGSLTTTELSVVVPVFLTRNDHVIVSPRSVLPSPLTSVTTADLVSCSARACTTAVSVDDGFEVTVGPPGLVAVAEAVLATKPASTSAWVITWAAAVQVVETPGASVVTGQEIAPAVASLTATRGAPSWSRCS